MFFPYISRRYYIFYNDSNKTNFTHKKNFNNADIFHIMT